MKRLMLFLAIMIQTTIIAQTPLEINSLDSQRNCWYRYFEKTQTLQLADFAGISPVAIRLSMLDLKPDVEESIKATVDGLAAKINLQGSYEAYLFCNGGGHSLVINAYESTPPVTFVTRVDDLDNGELFLGKNKSGFDMGTSAHTLLIKRKNNISSPHYQTLISSFFSEQLAAMRFIGNTPLAKMRVKPEYYYHLEQIKQEIIEHPVISNYTEYVELSERANNTGEHGLLFNGQF